MDPFVQAALMAIAGCALCALAFFLVVPRLPGDGREAERLAAMERERIEREAATKAAE